MKKIFISQRLDKVGKFYELRDNLDTRFSLFFEKLGMIPIIVPNNYYQISLTNFCVSIGGLFKLSTTLRSGSSNLTFFISL